MRVMASQGITSASDAATGQRDLADEIVAAYRTASESGNLAGRITLMPQIGYVAPPDSDEVRPAETFNAGDRPLWLRVGPTKIFSDGALTTRTAALRQPFADSDDNLGILIWDRDTLAGMIRRAHRAGWQIGTHAIGDRAIELVLDCYELALREHPRDDHRHRIEHCMLLDRGLGERIRQLGVVPTIQPGFMARLGDAYIAALGTERAAQLMPMHLFAELDIPVGFSSDRPVIPGLPLQGVRAAVERRTPEGVELGPEHALPALEAIRLYTAGSAYATHMEREKGVLRQGFLADFTVLSRDPATTPAEEFGEIQVTMTVVGGNHSFEL
jgi:predicted amidohydrolase YtcJ